MLVNPLKKEAILQANEAEKLGRFVEIHDVIGSTNDRAKELARAGAPHGTLVLAEKQTGGKGRRGRSWETPEGSAVAMSLLLRPEAEPEQVSLLTLAAALAQAKAIRKVTGLSCQIKWPNDLVAGGRKVCGILTELMAVPGKVEAVIVGTGINVNMKEFPEEIAATATSLALELGRDVDRNRLIGATMKEWEDVYRKYLKTKDASLWKEEYEAMLANKDREVRILGAETEETGVARGITATGELIVEREDGSLLEVRSGEVSVRGIYGYV